MIYEFTTQIRVADFEKGQKWYEVLLQRKPDFVPHADFAEWEIVPGGWLQVAKGDPGGDGPLRLGVKDIEQERERLCHALQIDRFEVFGRAEVPVRWGTFTDPWGNRIGLFSYLDEQALKKRQAEITIIERSRLNG